MRKIAKELEGWGFGGNEATMKSDGEASIVAMKRSVKAYLELKGRLDGMAIRVPTQDVSVVDLVAEVDSEVTAEEVNTALREAAEGPLKGILEYTEEPLVSVDFLGNPASSTVDALSTKVIGTKMVKVLSWYDNEWGFSCRMVDMIKKVGAAL